MLYTRKPDEGLGEEYRKGSRPLNFSGEDSEGQGQGLVLGVTIDPGTGYGHQQELFHGS